MRSLRYYRKNSGQRLVFRDSEILHTGGGAVSTVYGSHYRVVSTSPELVVEDAEHEDDGVHHFFHWTPPSSAVELPIALPA